MKKVLILGSKGMLGAELMRVFGNETVGWDRSDVDVAQVESLKLKVESLRPEIIINCVAYNDVDGAEENAGTAFKLNAEVPKNLASICNDLNISLIHFSTNYVFDGQQGEYKEEDEPSPLSVYAKSKHQGEQEIIKHCQKYYIIRTAVLFGLKGQSEMSKKSFVDLMLDLSRKTDTIKAVNNEVNSLTYVKDLAENVKLLTVQNNPFGIYHITNSGSASWYDLAKEIFKTVGKKINLVPVPSTDFPRKAMRPARSVLINTKLLSIRPWQEALLEFLNRNSYIS